MERSWRRKGTQPQTDETTRLMRSNSRQDQADCTEGHRNLYFKLYTAIICAIVGQSRSANLSILKLKGPFFAHDLSEKQGEQRLFHTGGVTCGEKQDKQTKSNRARFSFFLYNWTAEFSFLRFSGWSVLNYYFSLSVHYSASELS